MHLPSEIGEFEETEVLIESDVEEVKWVTSDIVGSTTVIASSAVNISPHVYSM